MQRGYEILDASAVRVAFLETHFADGFHATDLEALEVFLQQHLFLCGAFLCLVVPDFDFDTTIECAPFSSRVRSYRLGVTGPLVSDRFGSQVELGLQELCNFACAFAR